MTEAQYRQVVDEYHQPLLSLAFKMVHQWEIARDLTQDVFLRLCKKHPSVRFTENIYTLLYRMAMNRCIDYLRKKQEHPMPEDVQNHFNTEHKIEEKDLLKIIQACLVRLKPKQKAVFILSDMEGFEIAEIAGILKTTQGRIRSNLHLARKNIRAMLQKEYQITEEYLYDL